MTCHMCGNEHSLGDYCSDECANEAARISEFNALSFNNLRNGMQIIKGSDTWVDPVVIQKPKQKQKIIDFEDALAIFDRVCKQVIDRDGKYRWGKEPQDVVVDLLGKVFIHDGRYVIKYLDASEIMDRAKSSIMIGGINRGINTIKEVWKRSYIGEV